MITVTRMAQTSLEAYYSLSDDFLEGRQAEVYRYIRRHPDVTVEQIIIGLGADSPNQIAPRVTELLQMGAIERTGRARTRSGRSAYTFRVVEGFP